VVVTNIFRETDVRIIQIPALQDNYQHLVVCERTGQAVIIDPADAPLVMQTLKRESLTLVAILNTHHHWDHTGGNDELVDRLRVPVYCGRDDFARVPRATHVASDGETIDLGGLLRFSVLEIPGHTLGQVAFRFDDALFVGDTLFVAGCGRLFEGTAAQMFGSLRKICALPPATRLFGGHEYAVRNLEFALTVEPENPAVTAKIDQTRSLREQNLSTVPTTLAAELTYNPFLRVNSPTLVAGLARQGYKGLTDEVEVFAALRILKDQF
jgi:hydroxyacylglutathione hydrolase